MSDYTFIVIGAGPGGYASALRAAKLGQKCAVIESRDVGGTCLNRGCIPTKTLLHSSQIYHDARTGAHAGVHGESVTFDLPEIFARKREVSQTLREGIQALLKKAGVDLIPGHGTILAPGRVEVTAADGSKRTLTGDTILCATGSVPAVPPIPGLDLPGVMTSDALLEGADTLYDSLIIIGGGVIGIEFATFYAELGCKVTVLEGMDRLLPNMDRDLGQNLALILKKQGVQVSCGAMVQRVEAGEAGLTVHYTAKGKDLSVTGEKVLCAIGRKPYLTGLFAPGLEPKMEGKRLWVDDSYQTSLPGVYAIGDVSAPIQLAHVATAQGEDLAEKLWGDPHGVNLSAVPSCIYSAPEIASVGLTEAEAKERGFDVRVGKHVMYDNARTLIDDPGRCFMKFVADGATRKLLGAQLMCQHASDMIGGFAQALGAGLTVDQLLSAMRPHPSFEEAATAALEELQGKL